MTGPERRHVFLTGFMAAGKSTVGRELGAMLGLPFVDLDEAIASEQGQPVAAIFAGQGEAAFRALEAQALERLLAGPAAVVATGGGAVCHGDNLARMRARGLVVALTAPLEVLLSRAGDTASRPLLSRSDDEVRALYRQRAAVYRQAHAGVDTEHATVAEVACEVARLARGALAVPDELLGHATLVPLSGRVYPVIVAPGALARLGELARRVLDPRTSRVAVVTDTNVAPLHGEAARRALAAAGLDVYQAVVPAGEPSKRLGQLERLAEELTAAGLDRRSAVIALGGGVVGDLAGFAAATLFRGVACIQVPTTMIAMVDAAIGGKTGVNLAAGKNLVGAFWQPRLVLADPDVLTTLPPRERRAAAGEIVKYALLDGEELYAEVDALAPVLSGAEAASAGERERLGRVIHRCAALKCAIVAQDEREETGARALLNLGHTVGHAIEAAAGYGQLLHGEAVALGLVAACRVSAHLGLCAPALAQRVATTLGRAGLDVALEPWLREDVLRHVGVDKKRTGTAVGFITVSGPGGCAQVLMEIEDLVRILRQ